MFIPHWKETFPPNVSKYGFKTWWTNYPMWLPNAIVWVFII